MDLNLATTADICSELRRRKHPFVLIDMYEHTDTNGIVVNEIPLVQASELLISVAEFCLLVNEGME